MTTMAVPPCMWQHHATALTRLKYCWQQTKSISAAVTTGATRPGPVLSMPTIMRYGSHPETTDCVGIRSCLGRNVSLLNRSFHFLSSIFPSFLLSLTLCSYGPLHLRRSRLLRLLQRRQRSILPWTKMLLRGCYRRILQTAGQAA